MSRGIAEVSFARPMASIIIGATISWASGRIAANVRATPAMAGAPSRLLSSLTAMSCKFHSQLGIARGNAFTRRCGSAAASNFTAVAARWLRASYNPDSSAPKTGSPHARTSSAILASASKPPAAASALPRNSTSLVGSRRKMRGSAGSSALPAIAASTRSRHASPVVSCATNADTSGRMGFSECKSCEACSIIHSNRENSRRRFALCTSASRSCKRVVLMPGEVSAIKLRAAARSISAGLSSSHNRSISGINSRRVRATTRRGRASSAASARE